MPVPCPDCPACEPEVIVKTEYVGYSIPCPTCLDISECIKLNGTGGVHVNVPRCLKILGQ